MRQKPTPQTPTSEHFQVPGTRELIHHERDRTGKHTPNWFSDMLEKSLIVEKKELDSES